jgi:hypothetical protein
MDSAAQKPPCYSPQSDEHDDDDELGHSFLLHRLGNTRGRKFPINKPRRLLLASLLLVVMMVFRLHHHPEEVVPRAVVGSFSSSWLR